MKVWEIMAKKYQSKNIYDVIRPYLSDIINNHKTQ